MVVTVITFVALLLALPPCFSEEVAREGGDRKLSSRAEVKYIKYGSLNLFSTRLVLKGDLFSLLLIGSAGDQEAEGVEWIAGISSLFFSGGPVSTRGMLREIESPFGYSVSSDLWNECSGLNLDGSVTNKYRKSGFIISPLPDIFSLYLYRKTYSDFPVSYSGMIFRYPERFPLSNVLTGELLVTYNILVPEKHYFDYDGWYPDLPMIAGDDVSHLALLLKTALAGKGLFLRFMSCISGSGTIEPGWLIHALLRYMGETLEIGMFSGIKSNYYIDLEGKSSTEWMKLELVLRYFPVESFSIGCDYVRGLKFPGYPAGDFLEGKEKVSISNKVEILKVIRVDFLVEKVFDYYADGGIKEDNSFDISLGYEGDILKAKMEVDGISGKLELSSSLRGDMFKLFHYTWKSNLALEEQGLSLDSSFTLKWGIKYDFHITIDFDSESFAGFDALSKALRLEVGWQTKE